MINYDLHDFNITTYNTYNIKLGNSSYISFKIQIIYFNKITAKSNMWKTVNKVPCINTSILN